MALMFFAIPTCAAVNNVNLRVMRKLNDYTIVFYLNVVMLVLFLPYVYVFESGLSIMNNFSAQDWYIFVLLGFGSILMQILRKKAMTYEEPGKLGGLNFFTSVF